MGVLEELSESITQGNRKKAEALTDQALGEGLDYNEIMTRGLIGGMNVVGELFGRGEVYVPEVIMSSRAMKAGLELILPLLSRSDFDYTADFAVGTVKDDIHDIGRNLVAAVFTGSGFRVIDLGVDVPPEKFVEAVAEGAQVVGMSALIGPTMPNMKRTVEAIEAAGLRDRVKIIVGGALVTQEFADKIGADAYGQDAFDGVRKIKALLS